MRDNKKLYIDKDQVYYIHDKDNIIEKLGEELTREDIAQLVKRFNKRHGINN